MTKAKSLGTGQPARTAQADLSRHFLQIKPAAFPHNHRRNNAMRDE